MNDSKGKKKSSPASRKRFQDGQWGTAPGSKKARGFGGLSRADYAPPGRWYEDGERFKSKKKVGGFGFGAPDGTALRARVGAALPGFGNNVGGE